MVLKMVHDAYYKREFVVVPKSKKNKTDRKVKSLAPKVAAKPKKVGKINTTVGLLQSSQNSSSKGTKSTSSSSSKNTSIADDNDESDCSGSNEEDEVLFVKEETNRTKKIPAIITIQKVSVCDYKYSNNYFQSLPSFLN